VRPPRVAPSRCRAPVRPSGPLDELLDEPVQVLLRLAARHALGERVVDHRAIPAEPLEKTGWAEVRHAPAGRARRARHPPPGEKLVRQLVALPSCLFQGPPTDDVSLPGTRSDVEGQDPEAFVRGRAGLDGRSTKPDPPTPPSDPPSLPAHRPGVRRTAEPARAVDAPGRGAARLPGPRAAATGRSESSQGKPRS
jgi:hypothetical protein